MSRLIGIRILPEAKISRYLLDTEHPKGGPKARFLSAFGFHRDHPDAFVAALLAHADQHEIISERVLVEGVTRVIRGAITTPDRRDPIVDVVWFQFAGESAQRLATAYPAKAKGAPIS